MDRMCPHGHDLSQPGSTYKNGKGRVTCRECKRARNAAYSETERGQQVMHEAQARYSASEHGKAKRKAYNASPAGRASRAKYAQTFRGWLVMRAARERYDASLDGHFTNIMRHIRRRQATNAAALDALLNDGEIR